MSEFLSPSECEDLEEYQRKALIRWELMSESEKRRAVKIIEKHSKNTLKKRGVRGENIHRWMNGLPLTIRGDKE